jgi:hypothetical protein
LAPGPLLGAKPSAWTGQRASTHSASQGPAASIISERGQLSSALPSRQRSHRNLGHRNRCGVSPRQLQPGQELGTERRRLLKKGKTSCAVIFKCQLAPFTLSHGAPSTGASDVAACLYSHSCRTHADVARLTRKFELHFALHSCSYVTRFSKAISNIRGNGG